MSCQAKTKPSSRKTYLHWRDGKKTWQMKFHPDKCTVTRISTNRKQFLKTNYQIHGRTLEVVDSSKYMYLGATISEDLAWKKHIDNTVNKANRTLGFIRRNLGDCTAPVKAAVYSTLVRPCLNTPPQFGILINQATFTT